MAVVATVISQSPGAAPAHGSSPRSGRLPGLSIVLPCFNEVDNVREAIRQARRAAHTVAREHEIVVVDDGSGDGTGNVVAAVARQSGAVRLVSHPENRGYGA